MLDFGNRRATSFQSTKHQEHYLLRHLPVISAANDRILMLRDGDVMASFSVDGVAAATSDDADIEDLATGFASTVSQMSPDMTVYTHRFSTAAGIDFSNFASSNPFAVDVDERWQRDLHHRDLRERRTIVSVVLRPYRGQALWGGLFGNSTDSQRDARARRIVRLEESVSYLMDTLRAAKPERLTVPDGRWLGVLRLLGTGTWMQIVPGSSFRPLCDLLATSTVVFDGETFTVMGSDTQDMRVGAVFSVKSYPSFTEAGMFDRFDLPLDTVVTQSFTPMDSFAAETRVRRTVRQMGMADDAARSLRSDLVDAADDLASGRIIFGNHHCSVTVFARSDAELDEAAAMVRSAGQRAGCVMVREGIAARTAYFAQWPGNGVYAAGRASMISSTNFAGMAALHSVPQGLTPDQTPWRKSITSLPTLNGEVYRFNFHLPGAPNDRTVGHTLMLGRTGSGKTLTAAFLLTQALRVGCRIIAFDKDRGLEMPLRAMGGSYAPVRMGEPTGFNPFRAETDDRGRAWLTDWLTALMEKEGPLTAVQSHAVAEAVISNQSADSYMQNFLQFHVQFRSLDDDGELFDRMTQWTGDGSFGWLFSGEDEDPLRFDNQVTGFDLTEILDNRAVRTAWLSYVFRRIERTIEDEHPTIIILDEAWKMFDDAYFETRLKDWMLTMRKKNVVVLLLTQRVSHIRESRAGGSIFESAATTILFPNSRNTPEELAPLGLTDNEVAFSCTSPGESRTALVRSGDVSAFVNFDLGGLGGLLSVLGGGPGEFAPDGWREDPEFWTSPFFKEI